MVYKSKYTILVLGSDLTWLKMLNGGKKNIKVVVIDEIYNFAVNNIFIWNCFGAKYTIYDLKTCSWKNSVKYVLKRIASAI